MNRLILIWMALAGVLLAQAAGCCSILGDIVAFNKGEGGSGFESRDTGKCPSSGNRIENAFLRMERNRPEIRSNKHMCPVEVRRTSVRPQVEWVRVAIR